MCTLFEVPVKVIWKQYAAGFSFPHLLESSAYASEFDPGRIGTNFGCSGRVSHIWFGFGKFPHKSQIFQFFPLRIKKNLIGVGQRRVSLFFTAGQKYARVGSGSISSIQYN